MGGGQGFTISKKKLSLSNFLDFLFCCVNFWLKHISKDVCFSFLLKALLHYSMILEEKHLHSGFV